MWKEEEMTKEKSLHYQINVFSSSSEWFVNGPIDSEM